ncbi:MAG: type II toxin-antitoxin system VapC family toxin, partial [Gemmataceae bacterium]
MKVYCDSTILIYFLDSIGPLHEKAKAKLENLHSVSARLVFSDLTRLEFRVGPLKRNDVERLARFDAFFALSTVLKAGLGAEVFDKAAEIRARQGIKTADSLHLAAAMSHGCD